MGDASCSGETLMLCIKFKANLCLTSEKKLFLQVPSKLHVILYVSKYADDALILTEGDTDHQCYDNMIQGIY